MKKKLSILLCLTLLILSGCRASGNTIRFGAADIGGMYYSFANTFTELANEEYENYEFEVRATAGSSANLRLLSDNYIELGIAQACLTTLTRRTAICVPLQDYIPKHVSLL